MNLWRECCKMIKTHKRKKQTRNHGRGMGTCGTGARKNKRKSGHKGGKGMSGTGKRADHKKTLVTKLYGNKYFGKQGVTSKGTKRDIRQRINLQQIEENLQSFIDSGLAKKTGNKVEINLKNYKILGKGQIKLALTIIALEASKTAIEKVKAAGGELKIKEKKKIETPLVESPKLIARRAKANKQ